MTVRDLDAVVQALHDATCPAGASRRLDRMPDDALERVLVDALDSAESHFRQAIVEEDAAEQDRAVVVHRAAREAAVARWKTADPAEIRTRLAARLAGRAALAAPVVDPVADVLAPEPAPPTARALALKAERTNRELGERQAQVEAQAQRLRDRERARREWAAQEAERRRERSRWSRLGGLMGGGR